MTAQPKEISTGPNPLYHIHSSLGYRPAMDDPEMAYAGDISSSEVDVRIFHHLRKSGANRAHYGVTGRDLDAFTDHVVIFPSFLKKSFLGEKGATSLLDSIADTGIGKVLRGVQVAHIQIPFPLNDKWALAVVNISQSHIITGYIFGEREKENFASPDDMNYLICALQSLWSLSGLDLSVSPSIHLTYQAIPPIITTGFIPPISVLPHLMTQIIGSTLYYSRYNIEPFEGLQIAEPIPGHFTEQMDNLFTLDLIKRLRVTSKDLIAERNRHRAFKALDEEGIEIPFNAHEFESHPQLLIDWCFWEINYKFLEVSWVVPADVNYELTLLLLMHIIETGSKETAQTAINILFDITALKDLLPHTDRLPTVESLHNANTSKKDGPKFKNKKKGVLVSLNNNQGLLMVSPSGFLLRRESLGSNEWRLSGSNADWMNHRLFKTGFDEPTFCDYLGVESFKLVHKDNCKYCEGDEIVSSVDEPVDGPAKKKLKSEPKVQLLNIKRDYIKIGEDQSSKAIENLLPRDLWYERVRSRVNELIRPLDPEVFLGDGNQHNGQEELTANGDAETPGNAELNGTNGHHEEDETEEEGKEAGVKIQVQEVQEVQKGEDEEDTKPVTEEELRKEFTLGLKKSSLNRADLTQFLNNYVKMRAEKEKRQIPKGTKPDLQSDAVDLLLSLLEMYMEIKTTGKAEKRGVIRPDLKKSVLDLLEAFVTKRLFDGKDGEDHDEITEKLVNDLSTLFWKH